MYKRSLPKLLYYRAAQWALGGFSRLYFRVKVRGAEHVPATGPVVLLANHQSHLDPVIVGSFLPRPIGYLARDTLFTGALGPMIRALDAIPIDRDGSGLAGLRATLRRLKQGDAILLFPEGTRSEDGQLQPLKPGFIALVRRGHATVVPIGIAGSHEAMPRGKSLPSPKPIAMVCGKPLTPAELEKLDDDALLDLVSERLGTCLADARRVAGYSLA
jgi:1-acyl-sn-glycerol-3-phosphate acyltransferase